MNSFLTLFSRLSVIYFTTLDTGYILDGKLPKSMSPSHQVAKFFQSFPAQKFSRGQTVIAAGITPDSLYYISSGLVRQYALSPAGEILLLYLHRPGSVFPITCALCGCPNDYYYDCFTDCVIAKAPVSEASGFFRSHPEVSFHLNSRLAAALQSLNSRLEMQTFGSAYTRTASFLHFLAKSLGRPLDNKIIIEPRFTHREISSWIGVTRETASVQMALLQKNGVIGYRRHRIVITDPGLLFSLSHF